MGRIKFFVVLVENGELWVDGVKKQPGERRDFFMRTIEDKVGVNVNTCGLFEVCDGGPHYWPDKEETDLVNDLPQPDLPLPPGIVF